MSARKLWGRSFVTALVAAVMFVAAVALWVRWKEPRSIFFPERQHGAYHLPEGFAPEDVFLPSDGLKLHGWFQRARSDGRSARPAAGFSFLYLHGNAGNLINRVDKVRLLSDLGADVFIVDYRGYGLSEGHPEESGLYADARAAYRHLTDRRGVDPRTIVILGESLGSAVAVNLAREVTCAGVVLEASFTSVADVAQATYRFLPVHWLVRQRFDSVGKIAQVRAPIIFFHSSDDEYFSLDHPRRLMAAAKTATRLVEMHGTHDGASVTSAPLYRAEMTRFLAELRS